MHYVLRIGLPMRHERKLEPLVHSMDSIRASVLLLCRMGGSDECITAHCCPEKGRKKTVVCNCCSGKRADVCLEEVEWKTRWLKKDPKKSERRISKVGTSGSEIEGFSHSISNRVRIPSTLGLSACGTMVALTCEMYGPAFITPSTFSLFSLKLRKPQADSS